jgi:phosphate transport system permease protein
MREDLYLLRRTAGARRPRPPEAVGDRRLRRLLLPLALLSGSVVVLVFAFVLAEAWPALRAVGPGFVKDPSWHPAPLAAAGTFNLLPMLAGTALAAAGALLLAGPLGILSALFARYYAPRRVAWFYRRILELLAGIPSVVYGFWGLVVLVPLVRRLEPPGPSLLTASLILALMILPTVALFADAALAAVPREYARGAAALGFSRWTTLRRLLLPSARAGIAAGLLLATGRAIGETMAVLMVAGNVVQVPDSVFQPVRTLTANMALEMAYAMGDHRSALFASGLLLLVLAACLVGAAELIARREARV